MWSYHATLPGAKHEMINLYLFGFSGSVCVITFTPLYRLPPAFSASSLRCSPCVPSLPLSLPPSMLLAGLVEREDRTLRAWRGIFSPSWEMGSPTEGNGSKAAVGSHSLLVHRWTPIKQNPTNTSVAIHICRMAYVSFDKALALDLVAFTSVVYYPWYIKGADPSLVLWVTLAFVLLLCNGLLSLLHEMVNTTVIWPWFACEKSKRSWV